MIPRHRLEGPTWVVVAAHLLVACLDLADRAAYGRVPHGVIGDAADHPAWTVLQLTAGLLLGLAIMSGRHRCLALSLSVGVMGGWSVLMLAWGLGLRPPVSLVGPVLGLLVSVLALVLADCWADREV